VRNQLGQPLITPHILVSGIRWDSGTDAQRYWGTSVASRHWRKPGSRHTRPNLSIHAPESEDLPGMKEPYGSQLHLRDPGWADRLCPAIPMARCAPAYAMV